MNGCDTGNCPVWNNDEDVKNVPHEVFALVFDD